MIDSSVILLFTALFGVATFLAGIAWGNTVLFRMQKALNEQAEPEKRVSPWSVMGKGGGKYKTFARYEKLFGHTSLVRQDRYSARLIFAGAIFGFGSLLILKVRH